MDNAIELIGYGVVAVVIDFALIYFFSVTFTVWFISIWMFGLAAIAIGIILAITSTPN